MKWIDTNYPGRLDALQKEFNLITKYKDYMLEELYIKLKDELL